MYDMYLVVALVQLQYTLVPWLHVILHFHCLILAARTGLRFGGSFGIPIGDRILYQVYSNTFCPNASRSATLMLEIYSNPIYSTVSFCSSLTSDLQMYSGEFKKL